MSGRGETPRDVLNRLRWDPAAGGLEGVTLLIRHRGAPGDVKEVPAEAIVSLGKGSFGTDEATIPYHRILRISRCGTILFQRRDEEDLS